MKKTENSILTRPMVVCALAVFCCILWGSATPCIKTGYRLLGIASEDVGSVLLFAGCRFTIAGVLTILVTSLISGRFLIPAKGNWAHVFELSMVQTVIQYIFFYMGLANASGVKSSIVQGANVFIALLIASLVFKMEKLTVQKTAGCLIGFCGIVLVNVAGQSVDMKGFAWNGEGFVLLSIVAYSFSSVMVKRFSKTELPYTLSGYQFFFGGIILILCGFVMGGRLNGFTGVSLLLLFYMAFLSATAYTIWGLLLKYNSVGRVTIFSCTTPVFSVIMSAVFLHEAGQFSPVAVAASLLLICTGIVIVNKSTV